MSDELKTDVVVIGAGPIGLFAIFACGQLGMRCHVVDALEAPGGQCTALYPEKPIYDIPGFPEVSAADLVDRLARQATPFQPTFHLNQRAVAIEHAPGAHTIVTSSGTRIAANAVIVAAGGGAFQPNRPPVSGIEMLEGKSVFYCVTNIASFKGKRVVIAGGGDSAVDWALALSHVCASVTLVHRRDRFRASPASLKELKVRLDDGAISMKVPFQLNTLGHSAGKLTTVSIVDLDGREESLDADVLLPFFGIASDLGPLKEFGLKMTGSQLEVDPLTMATSKAGVYAIGDIAGYHNKQKLIVTGFAEAVTAARAAFDQVFPDRTFRFQHSTDRGAPVGFQEMREAQ